MESSTDVKSIVRGWLRASPNMGRIKLAPPPLVSAFSPRPERLGLGAVPPQDLETQVYSKQLEKKIQRKIVGKRTCDTEIGLDALQCDSTDEECSRSSRIQHGKPRTLLKGAVIAGTSVPRASLKHARKRKTKKTKLAPVMESLTSSTTGSSPACKITEDLEVRPLPERTDLLRGGSQQGLETPTCHLNREKADITPKNELAREEDGEKTCYKGAQKGGAVSAIDGSCDSLLKKMTRRRGKRGRHRNYWWGLRRLQRSQSLPWRHTSLRHGQRRKLRAQQKKLL